MKFKFGVLACFSFFVLVTYVSSDSTLYECDRMAADALINYGYNPITDDPYELNYMLMLHRLISTPKYSGDLEDDTFRWEDDRPYPTQEEFVDEWLIYLNEMVVIWYDTKYSCEFNKKMNSKCFKYKGAAYPCNDDFINFVTEKLLVINSDPFYDFDWEMWGAEWIAHRLYAPICLVDSDKDMHYMSIREFKYEFAVQFLDHIGSLRDEYYKNISIMHVVSDEIDFLEWTRNDEKKAE